MVAVVETVAAVEDMVTLVVMVGLVATLEVTLVDEVEVVMTGQILLMAFETLRMKNGGNLHIMVEGCMWLRLLNEWRKLAYNGGWLYVAQAHERMNGRGCGGCDGCGSRGDGCSGGHWNDNGGGHNVGAFGTDCNDEDTVLKWLAKVMLQVEIVVLSMDVDLVVEHIIIDYLGHRHCLLVLFMDLSKR
jgi:hypothetical protein